MKKMHTIPRIYEELNKWYIENPILQAKDYQASSGSIAQAENLLTTDTFGLIGKQNDMFRSNQENVIQAWTDFIESEQMNMVINSALDAMKKYDGCYQQLAESGKLRTWGNVFYESQGVIEDIGRTISELGKELGKELAKNSDTFSKIISSLSENLMTIINSATYMQTTKILEQYQNSIDDMFSSIQTLSMDKLEKMYQIGMDFDISDVSVSDDGALSYQSVTYKQDEVPQELVRQVQELKQEPVPLKQKIEEWKQKYWLIILIVNTLATIYTMVGIAIGCADLGQSIYEAVMDLPQMCYTIKEKSYIRNEANAKSDILTTLVYDTKLEILEDIPRWYKVKYIDETGTETEGWISKISVEE